MAKDKLETEFDHAMMEIYTRAKAEVNYNATIFHRMLSEQAGFATAKRLINDLKVSDGYTALWERGRLDLTVEAVVHDNAKWHSLFTQAELHRIARRLSDYWYLTD